METPKALDLARGKGYDLVEVSSISKPPVCRLLDFTKYKYKKDKQIRKHKAHQKRREIKGIRLSLRIGPHDLKFKAERAEKFLSQGHGVKVELILKGREHAHTDLARDIMKNFSKMIEKAEVEQEPKKQGNRIIMILRGKE